MVCAGNVDKFGKLQLVDRPRFMRELTTFAGRPVEITVRVRRGKRSDQQNAYYWGVVIALLAEHLGYQADEMHEALKFKFLREHDGEREGLPRVRSSAALNTSEFQTYIENVVTWAGAEFGLNIPDPNT
jgi:hypothetical protein